MSRAQKALTCLYAVLYVAGLAIVWMDVYVWRADEPKPAHTLTQPLAK